MLTAEKIIAVCQQVGFTDLAGLIGMGGPMADQVVAAINAAVAKKKASMAAAAPVAPRQAYTDTQIVDMTIDKAIELVTTNAVQTEEQLTNALTSFVQQLKAA